MKKVQDILNYMCKEKNMYLIVGLGNPEPEYSRTRHNMGFDVINQLARKYEIELSRNNYKGIYGTGIIEGQKVILVKPQTFMNASGECVREYAKFYKIPLENILVVYDDMDTEIASIRIRPKGGAGSHNGMKSMIQELGGEGFPRLRVGIGRPKDEYDRIDYVIGQIPDEEYMKLQEGQQKAVEAIIYYIEHGIDNVMNQFNEK